MINLKPSSLAAAFGLESPFCSSPATKTESAESLAAQVDSGQAGGITRKSNFDLTGAKLVKRGSLVSWHGMRFTVSKVRLGTCYPDHSVRSYPSFVACNSVQVVA